MAFSAKNCLNFIQSGLSQTQSPCMGSHMFDLIDFVIINAEKFSLLQEFPSHTTATHFHHQ